MANFPCKIGMWSREGVRSGIDVLDTDHVLYEIAAGFDNSFRPRSYAGFLPCSLNPYSINRIAIWRFWF